MKAFQGLFSIIKKKSIEATVFVIFGFGMSQIIRLSGNLVLTRLLVPELFGIITIARVFVMGIGLFSDIGTGPAIIRSKRANDPIFLNTAWTIQVIRSVILALISALIAYPISIIYKEPSLAVIIPIIGIFSIPDGLRSTSFTILHKELEQKKLISIELTVQVCSLVVMIIIAYFFRNIWALLIGELVGVVIRSTWSHLINKDEPNRFVLEKEAMKEQLTFGKWILISTAMMFLATQADRLLLSSLFSMTWFGVYSIAVTFAEIPKQVLGKLSEQVIFPIISKVTTLPREELRQKIMKSRFKLLLLLILIVIVLCCFGDIIIRFLYDDRYTAASWILPILSVGLWPLILTMTIEGGLLALGKPRYSALGNMFKFVYMCVAVPVFYRFWGDIGAVIAVMLNDIPGYILINIGLHKENLGLKKQDAIATLLLLLCSAVFLLLRSLLGGGTPIQSYFQ